MHNAAFTTTAYGWTTERKKETDKLKKPASPLCLNLFSFQPTVSPTRALILQVYCVGPGHWSAASWVRKVEREKLQFSDRQLQIPTIKNMDPQNFNFAGKFPQNEKFQTSNFKFWGESFHTQKRKFSDRLKFSPPRPNLSTTTSRLLVFSFVFRFLGFVRHSAGHDSA